MPSRTPPRRSSPPVIDSINRHLGEITATLAASREDLAELRNGFISISRDQMATFDDRRRQHQIILGRIEAVERTNASQTENLARMAAEVSAMRKPVAQFSNIRRRFLSVAAVVGAGVSVVWMLLSPLWNNLIVKWFG